MRILLDECLPKKLGRYLPEHTVQTVQQMGWSSVDDAQLLTLMETEFDVFITIDGNLTYQQNLEGRRIALIVLRAYSNKLQELIPLMDKVNELVPTMRPAEIEVVEAE